MFEVVFEGIKKFGSEVISAVMFTMLLWGYKRSRTFLKQYNRMKQEVATLRDEVRRLEGALNDSEAQKKDVQRQLEAELQAHDKTKAELQSVNEALKEANAKSESLQRQLEAHEQEQARLQSEIQRKDEAIRDANAQSADLQRQLEAQRQEQKRLKKEAQAQYDLGEKCYEKGNFTQAANLYLRAAEQNYAKAQYRLGFMYRQGKGVIRDDAEAIKWFRRAAQQGYALAQSVLQQLDEKW